MVPGRVDVAKDGWSRVSYGRTCGHCGLERLCFSSSVCRRCGAPKPAGSSAAPAARKRGMRPTQKSAPAEAGIDSLLAGLRRKTSAAANWVSLLPCSQSPNNCWKQINSQSAMRAHQKQQFTLWPRHYNVERPCRKKSRPNSQSWRKQQETPPRRWTRLRRRQSNVRRN